MVDVLQVRPVDQVVLEVEIVLVRVVVIVIIVVVVVIVIVVVRVVIGEVERQGLPVHPDERVVVHLEGVGEDVVGVVDHRVVVTASRADGMEVRFERCQESVQRGTRIIGHGPTVAPRRAQWQFVARTEVRTVTRSTSTRPVRDGWNAQGAQYEYRVLTIDRSTSRNDARRLLTDEAEYGRWELARSRLYAGGERKVWLRRKIIRVRSTL